jgi:hypothetical protein
MIHIKDKRDFDARNIGAKDACRIYTNKKPYMVRVEDSIHFTKDFHALIARKYPDVCPEIVEVYLMGS